MSIPARKLVNVIPSVLEAGGNPLSLNGVLLSNSSRIPLDTVMSFPPGDAVGNFFGPTSIEAILAGIYFSGFNNATMLPSRVYFAQYNAAAVAAYLRSGSFAGVTLAQLQELSGTLIVVIDGETVTTPNIDLSTATSFTNAAALVQAGLQTPGGIFTGTGTIDNGAGAAGNLLTISAVTSGLLHVGDTVTGGVAPAAITVQLTGAPGGIGTYTVDGAPQDFNPGGTLRVTSNATCTYDAQLARFVISSGDTGDDSTIGYATGTLAAGLKMQLAQGAVISPGGDAATPAAFMPTVALATQNWATFMTCFEPDTDTKFDFATWVQTTNERFAYVAWDSSIGPTQGIDPTSFGALCVAANMDGIYPRYEPATDDGNGRKAAFICGTAASIDFVRTNGRITFAFKGQSGLVADVTDEATYDNLLSNGYNCYAAFATANDNFINEQPGSTPGPWKYFDSYINQIWLNSELQLALVQLMTQQNFIPYNSAGYNLIRAACTDPITRALNAGVIQPGVTLSNLQRAQINSNAGIPIADSLQNNGYYLQILNAPPEVRAVRGSPPITLWYTDGGSIQHIELASINVQ
jgi:hypothetical protein